MSETELFKLQTQFSISIAHLILDLKAEGFRVTLGEAFRPWFVAEKYQKLGKGIRDSLHTKRLAIDLCLFNDVGRYLTETDDYVKAGEIWEGMSTPEAKHCWGGRFGDGNHFSIEFKGVK